MLQKSEDQVSRLVEERDTARVLCEKAKTRWETVRDAMITMLAIYKPTLPINPDAEIELHPPVDLPHDDEELSPIMESAQEHMRDRLCKSCVPLHTMQWMA